MLIVDIFENIDDNETTKTVKNIIIMFQHNNGVGVKLDVIQRELRQAGIQIPTERVIEIANDSGHEVTNNEIKFDQQEEFDNQVEPEMDYEPEDMVTPAEQKARDATRKALKRN